MAFLGLLIIVIGGLLGLMTFFGVGYDSDGGHDREVAIFSNNTTPEMVLVLGIVAGALVMLGVWFMKAGAQRGLRRRKESKQLNQLHDRMREANLREGDDDASTNS